MNLYPAIRARMGSWEYYLIRMTMREVAESVQLASKVYQDHTLDDAIQRLLEKGRVKKEIVEYLKREKHRFFSSIVIAALGGNAQWFPLEIADVPSMRLFSSYAPLQDTFGLLQFDGRQRYYALDGQHRLAAIRTLVKPDPDSDTWRDAPDTFPEEEISVIVIVRDERLPEKEFFTRYRRLFGNLNRYAKPMDNVTNIIMDEDDVFAIVTRRLITEHSFFRAAGRQRESHRIKTKKGKNLRANDSFFTSLETLYWMNETLLCSRERRNDKWSKRELKMYKRFRPRDDYIDELYEELAGYWDVLIDVLPELKQDPPSMRNHGKNDGSDSYVDSALFWPICQEVMVTLARDLLDDGLTRGIEDVHERLAPLAKLSWKLHDPPWRNLVLVTIGEGKPWKMRSEDRTPSLNVAKEILWFQVGLHPLSEGGLHDLHERWKGLLLPALPTEEIDGLWETIMEGVVRE